MHTLARRMNIVCYGAPQRCLLVTAEIFNFELPDDGRVCFSLSTIDADDDNAYVDEHCFGLLYAPHDERAIQRTRARAHTRSGTFYIRDFDGGSEAEVPMGVLLKDNDGAVVYHEAPRQYCFGR